MQFKLQEKEEILRQLNFFYLHVITAQVLKLKNLKLNRNIETFDEMIIMSFLL
jgi:hypothetical protein